MVLCAPVINNYLKVKYTLHISVSPLHSKVYQEQYESTSVNKVATVKNIKGACVPVKGAAPIIVLYFDPYKKWLGYTNDFMHNLITDMSEI